MALDPIDLAQASLARLNTIDPALVSVYDGRVPEQPAGAYVAHYPDAGRAQRIRQTASHGRLTWGLYAICVGEDPTQCIWVAGLVRGRLAGWRIDPDPGASPLNEIDLGNDVLPDDSVPGDPRYSFTLRYQLNTTRSLNG